jgi:3-hydroxyisobutyrate dehydrogenase-like beta-hydroxyacid dehydrogenase
MRIGFIGLGHMGSAIAANLVRASHEVAVWNRSADKARPLVALGARLEASPRAVAEGRDLVFTMLGDDAALQAVLSGDEGLYAGLARGAVHVSMSTIGVQTADAVAAGHAERGQGFLSAPVFGRPEAAIAAKLFIVAAGDSAHLQRANGLFENISQRVFHVGTKPSNANLVKLCGNFMILAAIESLAEAMSLADASGIPKRQLLEVLTGTLFDAPVYRNYGAILIEERFRPAGFAAPWGLKDMRLAGAAATDQGIAMPVLEILKQHLIETIANEGADIDWSGIAKTVAVKTIVAKTSA